ncbi:Uncharacterised protein [uncultured archaeon]|nr:Uncharacterised protein [uncultured archaeon]
MSLKLMRTMVYFKKMKDFIDNEVCLSRKLEKRILGKNHHLPHNLQWTIHPMVNGVLIGLGFWVVVILASLAGI